MNDNVTVTLRSGRVESWRQRHSEELDKARPRARGREARTAGRRLRVASRRAASDSRTWRRAAVSAPAQAGDNASHSG